MGENRRVLWSSIGPAIAAAIVGPVLLHGLIWPAVAVSAMILSALVAARSFSLDHQVLLKRLGERQSALAEVERKLAIAVEASGDGLFEADMIAGTRQISAGWAAMIGYDVAEIGDRPLISFVHPD
ncbi:MAG: PAS domain-containing protein [Caulobacteraceae bacterium]